MAISPPDILDDAEWDLAKDSSGYYLSSNFPRTLAPLGSVPSLQQPLKALSLSFVRQGPEWRGEAWFRTLDTESLRDAIDRLTFLENICISVNQKVYTFVDELWNAVGVDLQVQFENGKLPGLPPRSGHNRREPLF